MAPAFEFIFHFNKEIRRPNKTVEKKPENIKNRATSILRHRNNKTKPVYAKGHETEHTHKISDSVIRCVRHTGATEHPAVFPVALCSEIIRAYSNPGDIIYEPFAGSGTQIIAAERDDRICYAMEAAPEYCDIALRKVQKDTGLLAYRQDGAAFDDIGRDPVIKFDALLTI